PVGLLDLMNAGLITKTDAKSGCRYEPIPTDVRHDAREVAAVAVQIEIGNFGFDRYVLRQAKLGTSADRPAGLGGGIALGRASNHVAGRRRSNAYDLNSIPGDRRSALHIREEPIPIGVTDPSGRSGQPIHADFAIVEEAVGTGPGAPCVGPVQVAFDTEDPLPDLIVVSDFAAAEKTGKARVRRAGANDVPTRRSPVGPQLRADVETSPIVECLRGGLVDRRLGDHGSRGPGVRDKLVAKAAVHAPALDIVSGPVVAAQIADPARIHDLRREAQGKLAIGPHASNRDRRAQRRKICYADRREIARQISRTPS